MNDQHLPGQPELGSKRDKFLTALTETGFTRYVTPGLLRILFILGLVVIGVTFLFEVWWIFLGQDSLIDQVDVLVDGNYGGYSSSSVATSTSGSEKLIDFVLQVLNTMISILLLRIFLEMAAAAIRTAEAWQRIKQRTLSGAQF